MGKNKRNQTEDLSRQSDECRNENPGTEQGNRGRLENDISRQSVNNPGQRTDLGSDRSKRSSDSSSGRSSESSRTGSADQEPVDENSEDIP